MPPDVQHDQMSAQSEVSDRSAQEWTLECTERLQELLPLVFHPFTMVRRAMATFLTPLLFRPACRLADALADDGGAAQPQLTLVLYANFVSSHHFPIATRAMPLPATQAQLADAVGGALASLLGPEGREKTRLVGLVLGLNRLFDEAELRAAADEGSSTSSLAAHALSLLARLPGAALSAVVACSKTCFGPR